MKRMRKFLVLICCMAMCVLVVGCEGESGGKSIDVNLLKGIIYMEDVTYYDFFNNCEVKEYTGECTSLSGKLGSTAIWVCDEEGITRTIQVDKALSNKPKSIKLYKSEDKKLFDTYKCRY